MIDVPPALRSDSPEMTEAHGAAIGRVLRRGDVLALEGPLGAGKTCLVRGIVAGAGGEPAAVRSPTFVLHQPHRGRWVTIHHLDLYRLGPRASIEVLDLDSALHTGAAVIEWAHYADLSGLGAATVSMDGVDGGDDQRRLLLAPGAPDHIVRAWLERARSAAAP